MYEALRSWAATTDAVAIIGGWAVVELVEPGAALASRDVDLVFRADDAVSSFRSRLGAWRLRPVVDSTDRRLAFAPEEDPTGTIMVDVFSSGPWGRSAFGTEADVPMKPLSWKGFVPPLEWLLRDKLATVSLRMGEGAYDKQEKDLLDVHRLVFHNRPAISPTALLAATGRSARRAAGGERIQRAIRNHPEFAMDYRKLDQWLQS